MSTPTPWNKETLVNTRKLGDRLFLIFENEDTAGFIAP